MARYFISRHPGAVEWAKRQGLAIDAVITHLDLSLIQPGDEVLGTLPVPMVAALTSRGTRYWHLSINLPADLRGKELCADTLERLGARLQAFQVLPG